MAEIYFEKLTGLIEALEIKELTSEDLTVKHFFTGAALYVDKTLCASWSPGGLAFKLPKLEVEKLLGSGEAVPLKYFDKGHIKHGYVMFEGPDNSRPNRWKKYFLKAMSFSALKH